MTQRISGSNSKLDKALNPDQFNQIVDAILAGKYSWACLLILRFAGYNPLHYIPYRTYNRLVKENNQVSQLSTNETDQVYQDHQSSKTKVDSEASRKYVSNLSDLAYLEMIGECQTKVRGGHLEQWLTTKIRENNFYKVDLLPPKQRSFFSSNR